MSTNVLDLFCLNDHYESQFIGLAPLMRQAFAGADLKPLGTKFIEHLANYPEDAHALMNLATILLLTGYSDIALETQMEALKLKQLYCLPAIYPPKLRVLVLMSPGDLMTNTPVEFLLENSDITLYLLYLGDRVPAIEELPEHDVMMVAIGESDTTLPLLASLEEVCKNWPCPVINAPEKIARLGRNHTCELFTSVNTVVMPKAIRLHRNTLVDIAQRNQSLDSLLGEGDFPIIIRPVGSHAGHDLEKIETEPGILEYLKTSFVNEFYISRFVDYRNQDNLFRKYRIMLIQGKPVVAHMAISSHWMIHYLNAGMAESAHKRAEEAAFMSNFDQDFALRHQEAFRIIAEYSGLDYLGIDCSETREGQLLIFEIDSNMIVHALDPVELFPYKQPQMQYLFSIFREMLFNKATAISSTFLNEKPSSASSSVNFGGERDGCMARREEAP